MLLINNVNLPLDTDFSDLKPWASKALKTPIKSIVSAQLYKKSIDARHKNDIHFCCSLLVGAENEDSCLKKNKNAQAYVKNIYVWQKSAVKPEKRPVIVGFGPAGMFAALTLSRAGLNPLVLERGQDADKRTVDVNRFFKTGQLDTESNVQFGEGGAGTFSDGKLNTGIKDRRCRAVLEEFVKFGAPGEILTDAKPHIGTDILVKIVKNIRNEIISLGGEVRFGEKLEDIIIKGGKLAGVKTKNGDTECDCLILAAGHSARDTFSMLKDRSIEMIRKPFAMGVRIEHLQSDINRALYGEFASYRALSAADYKLAVHLPDGRGVYTFCMCPGGEVINASSENGGIAVNGMSGSLRDGVNANSALLVGIDPSDIEGNDVLEGCRLQKKIENTAFSAAGGKVPVTTVGNFVFGKSFEITKIKPTVKPEYAYCDFEKIFPAFITESLKSGIVLLDKKLSGFAEFSAVLTAPETRSSSPLRIVRNETGQSVSLAGLYPCGEGAGYAGGIMSAATDGMRSAEAVISSFSCENS